MIIHEIYNLKNQNMFYDFRDSVSMFQNKIKEDGNYEESDLDHFENIQSTNWQTMRFKPPPPGPLLFWKLAQKVDSHIVQ